jgi:hypothetical protein
MINSITGMNQVVVNGGSAFMPYVNMNNASAGMVRYNGSNQTMEVYDGTSWLQLNHAHASIDLSANANTAIAWAMQKMSEEAELQQMIKDHPAVRAAYEAFKKAGEQLRTTIILSKDETTTS